MRERRGRRLALGRRRRGNRWVTVPDGPGDADAGENDADEDAEADADAGSVTTKAP